MAIDKFPVEATHIMMFARAIGDTNPVYHDAEAAKKSEVGGIIAPPSFAQAVAQFDPDYHLRPNPGQKWFGSAAGPSGIDGKPARKNIRDILGEWAEFRVATVTRRTKFRLKQVDHRIHRGLTLVRTGRTAPTAVSACG